MSIKITNLWAQYSTMGDAVQSLDGGNKKSAEDGDEKNKKRKKIGQVLKEVFLLVMELELMLRKIDRVKIFMQQNQKPLKNFLKEKLF